MTIETHSEEADSVRHWHTLAREAEAALYAMTAERDKAAEALAEREMCSTCDAIHDALWSEAHRGRSVLEMVDTLRTRADDLRAKLDDATAQHGVVRKERDAALADATRLSDDLRWACVQSRETTQKIVDAIGAAGPLGIVPAVDRILADRLAALAQVTALQESAAENGRLRAELTAANAIPCREATAKICDALGMGEADDRTPHGALRNIVSLRRQLATWQDEGTILYAALDLRDAQEGDRIAAWDAASCVRYVCVRCWYPCRESLASTRPTALCDACEDDDDRDAAGAAEVAT